MNKLHNPYVKTFRAYHWKLFATTLSNCLGTPRLPAPPPHTTPRAPTPPAHTIRKQCFHFLRPNNGIPNNGANWSCLNFRSNQVSGCCRGNKREAFSTTRNSRGTEDNESKKDEKQEEEKRQDKNEADSEAKNNRKQEDRNRKNNAEDAFFNTTPVLHQIPTRQSSKSEPTRAKFNRQFPESQTPKAIFAKAHEEFRELQERNASTVEESNRLFKLGGERTSNEAKTAERAHGQKPDSLGEEEGNIPTGFISRKVKVGMQYDTEITLGYDDVVSFGKLSRDWNPIHYYPDDGRIQHLSRIFRIESVEEIEARKNSQAHTSKEHQSGPKSNTEAGYSPSETKDSPEVSEVSPPEDVDGDSPPRVPILPGALLNNLISGIMGTKLPGPGTVILHQTLNYKAMAFVDENIHIRVRITAARKMLVSASYKVWTYRGEDRVVILTGDARLICRT